MESLSYHIIQPDIHFALMPLPGTISWIQGSQFSLSISPHNCHYQKPEH